MVRQRELSDCGPAALLSVLRYWGGDASLSEVRAITGTGRTGTTLLGLRDAAEELGLEARGARGGYDDLLEQQAPFIVHLILDSGRSHFVVVFELDARSVHVGDPASGLRRMPREEFERLWRTGVVLLLEPTDDLVDDPPDGWIRWILAHLLAERIWLVQSLFLGAFATVLGLATALFVQWLIDGFIPDGNRPMILATGLLLIALLLLRSTAGYLRERFLVHLNRRVSVTVNAEFLSRLYRLPLRYFTSRGKGDVTSRLSDGVKIQRGVLTLIGTLVIDGMVVAGSFGLLLFFSPQLSLLAAVVLPANAAVLIHGASRLGRRQRQAMESYAEAESAYIDGLSGIGAVLDHAASRWFSRAHGILYRGFQDRIDAVGRIRAGLSLASELSGGLLVTLGLIWGAILVVSGTLQLGELMAAYSLLAGMLPAAQRLVESGVTFQETAVAATRMRDVMLAPLEREDGEDAPPLKSGIALEGVSLAWPGGDEILSGVSLEVPLGRITGLRGANGAGKTTIARLLNGTVPPDAGRVLVDGVPLRGYSLTSYRRRVALVPAEIHLFAGTLASNVLMGRRPDDSEHVLHRLEHMGFGSFLSRFRQGWRTPVGEAGRQLSSGERQAVGLLRGLAGSPDVLLVDEGVTSTDDGLSHLLLEVLVRFSWRGGVFLVSHDRHVLEHTQYLYLLGNGRIVDEGAAGRVLARDGGGTLHRSWSVSRGKLARAPSSPVGAGDPAGDA